MRTVVIESVSAVGFAFDNRIRQKRLENLLYRHRPGTRAASSVRRGKGLVQVDMKHVDPEVPRPRHSHQRIQIRAIHIDERPLPMKELRTLGSAAFRTTMS